MRSRCLFVMLDAAPLGLASNPREAGETQLCNQWIEELLAAGHRVLIPEIADYEIRRELIRGGKSAGLARLNRQCASLEYVPLTTIAMREAARLWARARQQGRPTAPDLALDGDVILAAQALTLDATEVTVATTNVAHLERYVRAEIWRNIG